MIHTPIPSGNDDPTNVDDDLRVISVVALVAPHEQEIRSRLMGLFDLHLLERGLHLRPTACRVPHGGKDHGHGDEHDDALKRVGHHDRFQATQRRIDSGKRH